MRKKSGSFFFHARIQGLLPVSATMSWFLHSALTIKVRPSGLTIVDPVSQKKKAFCSVKSASATTNKIQMSINMYIAMKSANSLVFSNKKHRLILVR